MPDDEPGNGQNASVAGTFFRFTCILALAFVLYVLSVGPAAKMVGQHQNSRLEDGLRALYYPLATLDQHSPAAQKFLHWYIEKVWHTHA